MPPKIHEEPLTKNQVMKKGLNLLHDLGLTDDDIKLLRNATAVRFCTYLLEDYTEDVPDYLADSDHPSSAARGIGQSPASGTRHEKLIKRLKKAGKLTPQDRFNLTTFIVAVNYFYVDLPKPFPTIITACQKIVKYVEKQVAELPNTFPLDQQDSDFTYRDIIFCTYLLRSHQHANAIKLKPNKKLEEEERQPDLDKRTRDLMEEGFTWLKDAIKKRTGEDPSAWLTPSYHDAFPEYKKSLWTVVDGGLKQRRGAAEVFNAGL